MVPKQRTVLWIWNQFFFLFKVISIQVVSIRPQVLRLHETFDQFKYSLHIWVNILRSLTQVRETFTPRLNEFVSKRLVLKRLCKEKTGYPKFNASRRWENRSKPSILTTARKKMEGFKTRVACTGTKFCHGIIWTDAKKYKGIYEWTCSEMKWKQPLNTKENLFFEN